MKNEESHIFNEDIVQYKSVIDRLNNENEELKAVIDDLEGKNRKLVEKLNDFIYNKATEYKERTLQALTKNDSPTKLKRAIQGKTSDERLSQIIHDENKPPE